MDYDVVKYIFAYLRPSIFLIEKNSVNDYGF